MSRGWFLSLVEICLGYACLVVCVEYWVALLVQRVQVIRVVGGDVLFFVVVGGFLLCDGVAGFVEALNGESD